LWCGLSFPNVPFHLFFPAITDPGIGSYLDRAGNRAALLLVAIDGNHDLDFHLWFVEGVVGFSGGTTAHPEAFQKKRASLLLQMMLFNEKSKS